MKKLLISLITILMLAGCTTTNTPTATATVSPTATATVEDVEGLSVICPMGAPAVALISTALEEKNTVDFVSGPDLLQAAFVNPTPQYDVIVAPSNLGAILATSEKTTYKMLGIVSWGNLYILATNENALTDPEAEIAAFGEASVVGLVFEDVAKDQIAGNITYYSSVSEAQAALLAGNADAALIAEPAATATIAAGSEKDLNITVVADLQELWQEKYDQSGYPQAAIFVSEDALNNKLASIEDFTATLSTGIDYYKDEANKDVLQADIDTLGVDTLGVPSAALISSVYSKMNLKYVAAKDATVELDSFMQLFGLDDSSKYIVE